MSELENVLDTCLSRLKSGETTLEACIARYPEYAVEIRRLVAVANQLEHRQNTRPSALFKASLRAQVIAHANAHPRNRALRWWSKVLSLRYLFGRTLSFVSGAAAIILLFLLTGTVLAQRALPGETLYQWKLASEQVLRVLYSDPLNAELLVAERRTYDLTKVVGTPQSELVARKEFEKTLGELSRYHKPQDQKRISETLREQKANLAQAQLSVPALDQLLAEVSVNKSSLLLDHGVTNVQPEQVTYRTTITNQGPTTSVSATVVYNLSPEASLVSTGNTRCTRSANGELVCEVTNLDANTPQNLSLTTMVPPCFAGIISSTAEVTATGTSINVNQDNKRLAQTTVNPLYPGYSQVAYIQSGGGHTHDLGMVIDNSTYHLHFRASAPTWSPDGSQLAFFGENGINDLGSVYSQGSGIWLIDVIDKQAQNPRQLVAQDHIKNIAWSPDGTKLAFEVKLPDFSADIMVVDALGGRQISHFPGTQPAWSPDSQKLAMRTCAPNCGVWLVNFDGSDLEQITFDSSDSYPAWSPTGQHLAFTSQQRDDNWEIYYLEMSSNQLTRLTNRAATDTTPVFGPCGQEIYLRTDHYGSWWITVVKLDGSDERQVKEGVGPDDEWGLVRPAVR